MSFSEASAEPVNTTTTVVAAPVTPTVENKTSAVVPVGQQPLATLPDSFVEEDDAVGEFNSSRYESHPSIKIVSKTSAQAEEFGIGTWVIGSKTQEPTAIGKMDKPIDIICVKMAMAWQEQVPYGEQRIPKMFTTLKEAVDAGFTDAWDHPTLPRVAEVVKALWWIPQPEGVDEPFVFSYEGPEGPGALAYFFAARTAFGTVGKSLIQAKRSFLSAEKGGLVSGRWELTATKASRNGNTWLLPRIKPAGKTSPELQEFLKGFQ